MPDKDLIELLQKFKSDNSTLLKDPRDQEGFVRVCNSYYPQAYWDSLSIEAKLRTFNRHSTDPECCPHIMCVPITSFGGSNF